MNLGGLDAPGILIAQPGRPAVAIGPRDVRIFVYSVVFVCGERRDACCGCAPLLPGRYATEINVHNLSDDRAPVIKRTIPLVLAGAARGREPRVATVTSADALILPPHTATMDDCCRLQELMLGAPANGEVPLTTGILEIDTTVELAVTAVYTTAEGTVDVQAIAAKRLL